MSNFSPSRLHPEGISIEFAKLRRTRITLMGLALSAGVVLFASMNLFAEGQIDTFSEDLDNSWSSYLVSYCMATAFLSPLQLAMLASRSADSEHSGEGWRLNSIAGVFPGRLVRRKLLVLSVLLAGLKFFEVSAAILVPIVLGAPAPSSSLLKVWIVTAIGAFGISLAVLSIFLWLASRIESQLVVLGLGVIGGFLGIAALLSPPWLAAVNPFGYYALITPYGFSNEGIIETNPNWILWGLYLFIAMIAFHLLTQKLNRKEV